MDGRGRSAPSTSGRDGYYDAPPPQQQQQQQRDYYFQQQQSQQSDVPPASRRGRDAQDGAPLAEEARQLAELQARLPRPPTPASPVCCTGPSTVPVASRPPDPAGAPPPTAVQESRVELLGRVNALKRDLHDWRSKLEGQARRAAPRSRISLRLAPHAHP